MVPPDGWDPVILPPSTGTDLSFHSGSDSESSSFSVTACRYYSGTFAPFSPALSVALAWNMEVRLDKIPIRAIFKQKSFSFKVGARHA